MLQTVAAYSLKACDAIDGFLPCAGQGAQVLSEQQLQVGTSLKLLQIPVLPRHYSKSACVPSIADFSIKAVLIVIKDLLIWQCSWSYTTCYFCSNLATYLLVTEDQAVFLTQNVHRGCLCISGVHRRIMNQYLS